MPVASITHFRFISGLDQFFSNWLVTATMDPPIVNCGQEVIARIAHRMQPVAAMTPFYNAKHIHGSKVSNEQFAFE